MLVGNNDWDEGQHGHTLKNYKDYRSSLMIFIGIIKAHVLQYTCNISLHTHSRKSIAIS